MPPFRLVHRETRRRVAVTRSVLPSQVAIEEADDGGVRVLCLREVVLVDEAVPQSIEDL